MWSNLLLRSCWWTAQLLDPCHSWHIKAAPILVRSICCILVECMIEGASLEGGCRYAPTYQTHISHLTAQEALIEALTHVDADELQVAIKTLEDNKQSRFLPVLDNGVFSLL